MSGTALAVARRARRRRRVLVALVLAAAALALFLVEVAWGRTLYPLDEVLRVILGERVPGASYTVGEVRLPRAILGALTGICFGVAGVCFQTLLRNPLASPDIIGISSGASAAAVTAIVMFGLGGFEVSLIALAGALLTALAIYLLSSRGGFAGTRLILIGIGLAAMLQSVIFFVLSRAAEWEIQQAMQWMTGSLNDASWDRATPLAAVCLVLLSCVVLFDRSAAVLRFGDDSAAALGVRVSATRLTIILVAVALLAFATAAAGPVSFVAFMAGPIAARLLGPGASLLLPSGLVGAVLVLAADLAGQYAFDARYPVGVITGVLGAPYLIYLLIRTNRQGASL